MHLSRGSKYLRYCKVRFNRHHCAHQNPLTTLHSSPSCSTSELVTATLATMTTNTQHSRAIYSSRMEDLVCEFSEWNLILYGLATVATLSPSSNPTASPRTNSIHRTGQNPVIRATRDRCRCPTSYTTWVPGEPLLSSYQLPLKVPPRHSPSAVFIYSISQISFWQWNLAHSCWLRRPVAP